MNRYETNSKGTAPALSALLNKFAEMPRSAFDETRRKSFDASPFAIIPVETFLMFPNSDGYLRYDVSALTKNPTIRRMLSSMNIELRTYKCKCSDLWEGWNNFVTRGRSGKLNMQIPNINFLHNSFVDDGNTYTFNSSLPYNPYHYLNICPPVYFETSQSFVKNTDFRVDKSYGDFTISETGLLKSGFDISSSLAYNKGISALPGVMYCKIAKEYQNSNLLQENPYWYPENENHDLILPYNCTEARTACYDYPNVKFIDTVDSVQLDKSQPTNDKKSMPWINVLYYRQRKGNYFNTGSPFPDLIRGDVPTLQVLGANVDFEDVIAPSGPSIPDVDDIGQNISFNVLKGLFISDIEINNNTFDTTSGANNSIKDLYYDFFNDTRRSQLKTALNKATVQGINFSMSQWRKLATMTVFRERMARTDGSYNQMIQAQFNHNPRWHEHSVIYCGGSSQPIVFSEVVQSSEDGSTPLGTTAGRAVSSSSSREIAVHADDYEIFMTVMTITPDDYYSQGIDRMWSELTQSEQYFPILNNLNPQAIKNKELFVSGTDNTDEDIFNYQELFSHFKSRQNQVSGLMALPVSKVGDTGTYLFNRLFNDTPSFNNAFVTGNFTDNENLCFASTEQAQFVMSIVSSFKYVAPMPAVTQPSDMGISY